MTTPHLSRRSFLAAVAAGAPAATGRAQPASVAVNPQAVGAATEAAMTAWSVPGACVGVVHNDKVVHLKGYGVRDVETRTEVTPGTLFGVGSCTKAVAAATAAVLVDQGKLSWDDPVRKHVPWFRMADPLAERDVTLRDCLCHRTGLHHRDDIIYANAAWPLEENVRRIAHLELGFPFRSTFHYSGLGYFVAAAVLTAAAGRPWHEFARDRLLAPLGMTAVGFTKADWDKTGDRATTHLKTDAGKVVVIPPWNPVDGQIDASGRFKASGRAMCEWIRVQLNGGKVKGKQVVSEENLRETQTPQMAIRREGFWGDVFPKAETIQMSYGLGWNIRDYRGHAVISHAGKTDGFSAEVVLVPGSNLGFVILSNLDFLTNWMPEALMHTLLDMYLGLPKTDWDDFYRKLERRWKDTAEADKQERAGKQQKGTKPTLAPGEYAGTYSEPGYGEVRVTEKSGTLTTRWSTFVLELRHYHYDTFTAVADDGGKGYVLNDLNGDEVAFALDGGGRVGTLEWRGRRFKRAGAR
ncbi:MAG: serine hydrolase [Gemmataceae bacterium]